MTELCWIVLDDSGSLTSYDERIRRIHASMRDEFECSFDVRTWTTSSSYGMGALSARPIGSGGGDGMSKMFDMLTTDRGAFARSPCFVVYLTDGEANLTPDIINAIRHFHVVLVDITDPRWNNECDVNHNLTRLHDFLIHDCEDDCCECDDDYDCECSDDPCLESFESGSQPFYPNWARQVGYSEADQKALTDRYLFRSETYARMLASHVSYFDELSKVYKPPEALMSCFKHPVDTDLDAINREIDRCVGQELYKRASIGCELNGKIKKVVGGNSLTPKQQERIKATQYRLYTVCLDMPHEAVIKSVYGTNTINIPEVQEGQPMSHAQITTTVSLKVASSRNATVRDLKTLITEVERVGGTDDSFVNLENAWRNGCLDAIVVVAVDVTEPELDPQVACILSIKDTAQRVSALMDLHRDTRDPLVREQIKQALIGDTQREYDAEQAAKATKKATARKTTQAKS
jgi:hypothetical protein